MQKSRPGPSIPAAAIAEFTAVCATHARAADGMHFVSRFWQVEIARRARELFRTPFRNRRRIMALPTRVNRGMQQYDPFESAQREFDTALSRFFTGGGRDGGQLAPYAVDVREDADHIYVEAEMPGFKKDEIDVTLENQTLTISGERREGDGGDANKGEHLLHERRYTRFLRSFTLPPTVDEQSVNAKLADGLLTITLNKREETKPRKIDVA
jgi:HSP20 family protein